ncbi:MAG: hypothetical protein RIR33_687, partial [Pseudomonadota bacterium]
SGSTCTSGWGGHGCKLRELRSHFVARNRCVFYHNGPIAQYANTDRSKRLDWRNGVLRSLKLTSR